MNNPMLKFYGHIRDGYLWQKEKEKTPQESMKDRRSRISRKLKPGDYVVHEKSRDLVSIRA